ncbi:MAG: N-(5'-phosphoribosyl)anthranilate isomerase [Clostridiales bacterium GWF2_36_10]|nr:MAG: N-(5'-phosphoribosyl)anthranilate isomerase [Clostridiales bacterium GWF2_36_10]HAN20386.1 N-(5'-phosphoribosyl)anthranilate isomerase [Clostridiales bacterium]
MKTKIKICGLSRLCDINAVNEVIPDFIGFVFAKSRRQVSLEQATALKKKLSSGIKAVGVFVNSPIEEIMSAINTEVIDLIQLHGNEDENYIKELKLHTNKPIIKAVCVNTESDILDWNDSATNYLLLDNGHGGTGKMFDWKFVSACKKDYFLAGGINQDNIEEALTLHPFCIDTSSGVETDGFKDKQKIKRLVDFTRRSSSNGFYIKK